MSRGLLRMLTPKLGPWVEELERRLEANEGEKKRDLLSLLRILEGLAERGYRGGYDAVRRYGTLAGLR